MSDKIKLKKSKDSNSKYPNTLISLDRALMSARREISDPKLLQEVLGIVGDLHDKLKEESKKS